MHLRTNFSQSILTRSARTRSALALVVVGALSAGFAPSAHAAISIFTDQTLFENAFPNLATGSFLNTFTGTPALQTNFTASGNGFSYAATQSGVGPQFTSRVNNTLQAFANGADLIFTATGGNYNTIGGNFFRKNFLGNFASGAVTVIVSNGTETATQTFSPASATAGSFRGFVSTLPITTLTITEVGSSFGSADNLRVGSTVAPVNTAAPEPGSLALLLPVVGVAGIVIRKRRGK